MPIGFNSAFRTNDETSIAAGVAAAYEPQWLAGKGAPSLQATKYSRYGTRQEGLSSILDSEIVSEHIKKEKRNLGEGYVQMKIMDDNKKNKPINIGGRLHYADPNGVFTIIDEKYVEIMKEREMEKREYIEGIIQTAVMSDECAATLLGIPEFSTATQEGLDKVLGPNSGHQYGVPRGSDLHKIDARPSAIETYAESSQAYSNAVQKFKMCIKAKMPILAPMTTDKTLNDKV